MAFAVFFQASKPHKWSSREERSIHLNKCSKGCKKSIFIKSHRFYVKLILENLEVLNLFFFFNFLGPEFCSFGKFQPFKNAKIQKNHNTDPLNVLK